MRLRTLKIVLGTCAILYVMTGCASLTTSSTANQNQVYAAGQSLALLGTMVTAYDNLPACPQPNNALCSTEVMKQNLAKALVPAIQAYLAAQSAVQAGQPPDMTILNAAIATLQSLTSSLPKS